MVDSSTIPGRALPGPARAQCLGGLERTYQVAGVPTQSRTADEFTDLAFAGLAMVDPGVVLVSEWRPDSASPRPLAKEVNWYGGVGRKG